MPTRTVTEEFCDVCYGDEKQKETIATDRLRFSWLGKDYVVLVCDKHVGKIREALQHFSELGSVESGTRGPAGRRLSAVARAGAGGGKTLYSQLSDEEKERFRVWADMPNARRIADARVEEWTAAGRP